MSSDSCLSLSYIFDLPSLKHLVVAVKNDIVHKDFTCYLSRENGKSYEGICAQINLNYWL